MLTYLLQFVTLVGGTFIIATSAPVRFSSFNALAGITTSLLRTEHARPRPLSADLNLCAQHSAHDSLCLSLTVSCGVGDLSSKGNTEKHLGGIMRSGSN